MSSFDGKSPLELLSLHVAIMDELRDRGIIRSGNNPTGDYAEHLFCKRFGWKLEGNSRKGYDAIDDAMKYQIKGRRLNRHSNQSRQLSAIRDLDGFNVLAGVLFDHDFRITRAALIPVRIVQKLSAPADYTNSFKLFLRDQVWDEAGVRDVTAELREVELG